MPRINSAVGTPYKVTINAGVNGWSYQVEEAQTGTVLTSGSNRYGEDTNQFDALGAFYRTYRINSVELSLHPSSMAGTGNNTAIFSIVDAAATSENLSVLPFPEGFSRSRTLLIHPPQCSVARRKLNFDRWLTQCLPEPYLPCYDTTGARSLYPVDGTQVSRVPAVSMTFFYSMNDTGGLNSSMTFPFSFLVKAKYTYRGRVLTDPLGVLARHIRSGIENQASPLSVKGGVCDLPTVSSDMLSARQLSCVTEDQINGVHSPLGEAAVGKVAVPRETIPVSVAAQVLAAW
jgi:hypothetical protein